jgi:hypothetical protein
MFFGNHVFVIKTNMEEVRVREEEKIMKTIKTLASLSSFNEDKKAYEMKDNENIINPNNGSFLLLVVCL